MPKGKIPKPVAKPDFVKLQQEIRLGLGEFEAERNSGEFKL